MKDEDKIKVLMEYLDEKFEMVEENFGNIRAEINGLKADVSDIKDNTADMSVMRQVIKEHSHQITENEKGLNLVRKQIA
jgi:hypothetical protein